MFNFLRKHKPQEDMYEIPESNSELKLSVRERALKVFSNIEGLDDNRDPIYASRGGSYCLSSNPSIFEKTLRARFLTLSFSSAFDSGISCVHLAVYVF